MAKQLILSTLLLPTLSSAASAVSQLMCEDTQCGSNCNQHQWNINQCYNTTGGNSQIFLSCDSSGGLRGLDYTGADCQGQGTSGTMDVGKCIVSETNASFINSCVGAAGIPENSRRVLSSAAHRVKALRPAASAVSQLTCQDTQCSSNCNPGQWNINQCYNTTGGNSQIFTSCASSGVNGIDYTGTDCQGQGTPGTMDVGKCLISETNTSFINTCVSGLVLDAKQHAASSTAWKSATLVV